MMPVNQMVRLATWGDWTRTLHRDARSTAAVVAEEFAHLIEAVYFLSGHPPGQKQQKVTKILKAYRVWVRG
jgi:hypothetical protein